MAVVEGFCTYSLLMEEVKAGRVTVKATARLELYRLINGYLMGTQPAVELTPYRRTAQGQLLNNN